MKKRNKIISSVLVGTFVFGVASPLAFNVKEVKAAENEVLDEKFTQKEVLDLLELQNELQKHNITTEDIVMGIQAELPREATPLKTGPLGIPAQDDPLYGPKSQAAKIAAKQAIKNLQRIGRVSWDRTVRQYIAKLPISQSAKNTAKAYLAYETVMKTLNIVVNFEGTITDALSKQLKRMGCPSWLADMVARAIVTLLL